MHIVIYCGVLYDIFFCNTIEMLYYVFLVDDILGKEMQVKFYLEKRIEELNIWTNFV